MKVYIIERHCHYYEPEDYWYGDKLAAFTDIKVARRYALDVLTEILEEELKMEGNEVDLELNNFISQLNKLECFSTRAKSYKDLVHMDVVFTDPNVY